MHRVASSELASQIQRTLMGRGLSQGHARDVAHTLIHASLLGIDTHGAELLPVYLRELDGGRANATPNLRVRPGPSAAAVVEADNALGPVAAAFATREAVARARNMGIGAVAVARSNHFGAAGIHARNIAALDQIGLVLSNSDALVAPVGGCTPLLGTNPIAVAARGEGDDGFFLDMATSAVAYTRVLQAVKTGTVQTGWAIDAEGRDAALGGAVAALLPVGGYKGQGLGMLVHILCAVITGMPSDTQLTNLFLEPFDTPRKIGHFVVAIDVSPFLPIEDFRRRLTQWLTQFRQAPSVVGSPVRVPGDLEREARHERLRQGIPVSDVLLTTLAESRNA